MVGAGDNGGVYHQLDGSQCLLLDVMTTQIQRLLNRSNEELYRRIVKSSSFILKPLSPREVCDQIRMREKREQEKENSEAPQRIRKKKSDTPEGKSDTHKRDSDTHERKFNYFAEAS